ncbi:protein BREAST CANCER SUSCEPTIBILITY 2 homolog B-like [Papaver somniferum]|uniref:protein BREAST CANCER SUSCEPTIBILITY 2 homolog B-like n=1 Tax=Papaver somniferum TaxID=3469 RepID=UPI000E70393F|nr:protein BREAST CANCER SUSCEPTIBILITY 2 homolog B-like [Papaver somniferum]
MKTTQRLPAWQIFSDDGNSYRWVAHGHDNNTRSEEKPRVVTQHEKNPNSRLPSMQDLLFQGSSKLFQSNELNNESPPMFRTGLGKSVAVKKSSILKALSVLGEDTVQYGGGQMQGGDNGHSFSNTVFQTGSGKTANVSVLGEDNVFNGRGGQMQGGNNGHSFSNTVFQIGSGKTVNVSVFGEDTILNGGGGQTQGGGNGHSFSNTVFQTGSGKPVNVSSAGLMRAKTLLGLDGDSSQLSNSDSEAWGKSFQLEEKIEGRTNAFVTSKSIYTCATDYPTDTYITEDNPEKEVLPSILASEIHNSSSKPSAIKFQTAGGRSISISDDALRRARSLLGDSEIDLLKNEGSLDTPGFSSFEKDNPFNKIPLNKESDPSAPCLSQAHTVNSHSSNGILPTKGTYLKHKQFPADLEARNPGDNLVKQINGNGLPYRGNCAKDSNIKPSRSEFSSPYMVAGNSREKDIGSRVKIVGRPLSKPLVDISNIVGIAPRNGPSEPHVAVRNSLTKDIGSTVNTVGAPPSGPFIDTPNNIGAACGNKKQVTSDKRKLGSRSSPSPFKRPRCSRFSAPLDRNISFVLPNATCENSLAKPKLEKIENSVKCMSADRAEAYMFLDASSLDVIGAEGFHQMLVRSGASMLNREWVVNHYKWIIWKLACYGRGYPEKGAMEYLTVLNVLEELKYRYEREVNHAHRSAIKRILEGDASAASMVVLCISAVRFNPNQELEAGHGMAPGEEAKKPSSVAKIELTDGWYSVNATLDVALTNLLIAGKLFVGQKLRIWRASLCGWVAPTSPLEASKTVSLPLHINGTYRAHWAARLGFCKELGPPLAFRCIKADGGLVPRTLVGVTRVYPVLYKERLTDVDSVVRSERLENKARQLYNERRSTIAEGIALELQREVSNSHGKNDSDSEEGAQIFKILEGAAEPDVLMADMSAEQLNSFSIYKTKQEAIRQSNMQKVVEKALEDAGLNERLVTPFMRVRVVGLTSKDSKGQSCTREGLITIWSPTEKQQLELVEGQAYIVSGLKPLKLDSNTLYIQANGSTIKWQPLASLAAASFESFFSPRKSIFLSNMGEVSLASEFDIAAVVVYVGESYTSGHQKKQWVFVTDDSMSGSKSLAEGSSNCLLAISFCSPSMGKDSFASISYTLEGSTVGFCNLVKRAKDQMNNLWVAEATDNSAYSLFNDLPASSHLKIAATSAYRWAKISSSTIQKLRERVLFILGDSNPPNS